MNAHIINCPNYEEFENFMLNGFVGVGIYVTFDNSNSVNKNCLRQSYSMYADMATVSAGDLIFIHCESKIYGIFEARSEFKEDPNVNSIYHISNVHWDTKPGQPNSGWQYHFQTNIHVDPGLYRQFAIASHFENSENCCFIEGFDANHVFKMKKKGLVLSVPDRWKYPDSRRTVRYLDPIEANQFAIALRLANRNILERRQIQSKILSTFIPIEFVLNSQVVQDEKIIEGWICRNLNTQSLQAIFGTLSFFANNYQIGYLQGIDIFGYSAFDRDVRTFLIVEIKTGNAKFPDDYRQLKKYMDWTIEFMAGGDSTLVCGVLVASNFKPDDVSFIERYNHINTGSKISLVKFNYQPPLFDRLLLGIVNEN